MNRYVKMYEMFLNENEDHSFEPTTSKPGKGGSTTIFDSPSIMVTIPHTHEVACKLSSGARWCTGLADKQGSKFFELYNNRGPLFIILDKKTGEKFQMHLESNLFLDSNDRPIDAEAFFAEYPEASAAIMGYALNNGRPKGHF